MSKSKIQEITSIYGCETIANYLGVSEQTISSWRKRGYASLPFIIPLSNYKESNLTIDDFIQDISNALKKERN
jgi:hypothetical protein